jgi:hypothetical protein
LILVYGLEHVPHDVAEPELALTEQKPMAARHQRPHGLRRVARLGELLPERVSLQ